MHIGLIILSPKSLRCEHFERFMSDDVINACNCRKVYCFADVPHLLKLLRSHILDQGLRLPSGEVVGSGLFEKLLAVDSREFRLAHKLDRRHIDVRISQAHAMPHVLALALFL